MNEMKLFHRQLKIINQKKNIYKAACYTSESKIPNKSTRGKVFTLSNR